MDFTSSITSDLEALKRQSLLRSLRQVDGAQDTSIHISGNAMLNFASNDYLGLAAHPELRQASAHAAADYGAGSGASRLICGSLKPHHELEEALAEFKHVEAALTFSSGFAAALGAICALVSKGDVVVLDRLAHACLVDAAKLSGATLRVFKHNNTSDLERILKSTRDSNSSCRVLVVTESVFSMDGDHAPLRELVAVKNKYGAWLMVDEAHATGLYGASQRGLAEELDTSRETEVQMGTLGKALGSAGGFICGSRLLVDLLTNRARSFIFSTAPVPAATAAATAAIQMIISGRCKDRLSTLWSNVAHVRRRIPRDATLPCPILPLHVGDESAAIALFDDLMRKGIFIPAVRYPAVARGKARLRLTLSASHTTEQIATMLDVLEAAGWSNSA